MTYITLTLLAWGFQHPVPDTVVSSQPCPVSPATSDWSWRFLLDFTDFKLLAARNQLTSENQGSGQQEGWLMLLDH